MIQEYQLDHSLLGRLLKPFCHNVLLEHGGLLHVLHLADHLVLTKDPMVHYDISINTRYRLDSTLTLMWECIWLPWRPPCATCRGPPCCSQWGTPPSLSPLGQIGHFSHLGMISGVKTAKKRRLWQPAGVVHVLHELVHLVAHQGCVRDPKCGT